MQLNIPFYTQETCTSREEWKRRACGIAALKMVWAFHLGADDMLPSGDALIDEGRAIGGYSEAGWQHEALVRLARNHGFHAYRQEWRSRAINVEDETEEESMYQSCLARDGMERMYELVASGYPVITSVLPGFGNNADTHLIVLSGAWEEDDARGFFFHDPGARTEKEGAHNAVSEHDLFAWWRMCMISVYPSSYIRKE